MAKPPRAWQRMLSGRRLDLLDPTPVDIEIEDIAHGLAFVARWNGQTRGDWAFSVAEHSLLVEALMAQADPGLQGMGTTLTSLWFHRGRAYLAHVGDSRAYLFRDGRVQQLSDDHSWVSEQVRAGMMTEEEARESKFRHIITRSVGFERDDEVLLLTPTTSFNFELARPAKLTGLFGTWTLSRRVDLTALAANGWDSPLDPNHGKTVGARLGLVPA